LRQPDTDSDANSNVYADSDANSYSYSDGYSNSDGDGHSDSYGDCDGHFDANRHSPAQNYADAEASADASSAGAALTEPVKAGTRERKLASSPGGLANTYRPRHFYHSCCHSSVMLSSLPRRV
jgi:hypothetical protein